MSVSTEVQRTLVKSPPELWSELSTPEGLARHFGDLGEIQITKVEPETTVEWEAPDAAGLVQLKQSGWGTKVTLSLTREPVATEPVADPVPEPAAEEPPAPQPETVAAEAEPTVAPQPEPTAAEPVNVIEVWPEPEPVAETPASPEPEPKRGFFARIFKRKPRTSPAEQPLPSPEPQPPADLEIEALAQPEPVYPDPPAPPEPAEHEDPKPDPAADLAALEAQMEQEATQLLTGVLDRLGSAHHRPFSRA